MVALVVIFVLWTFGALFVDTLRAPDDELHDKFSGPSSAVMESFLCLPNLIEERTLALFVTDRYNAREWTPGPPCFSARVRSLFHTRYGRGVDKSM